MPFSISTMARRGIIVAAVVGVFVLTTAFLQTKKSIQKTSRPRITVEAYVESLCIDCKNYMNEELVPTWDLLGSLGPDIIDLQLVVFGNSEIVDFEGRELKCQHGQAECDVNAYEQCAIKLAPEVHHLPFVQCLYNSLEMGHRDKPFEPHYFLECAKTSMIDWTVIEPCRRDPDMSWSLQLEAKIATPKEHDHVPWIVVDGQHVPDDESLLDQVCAAYKAAGGEALSACEGSQQSKPTPLATSAAAVSKVRRRLQQADVAPIPVLVSVESLCPGCKGYMNEQIVPAFDMLGPDVMDLQVVVFGNARILNETTREIDCQHGLAECDANAYEQCAVSVYPDVTLHLPFLHCMDNSLDMGSQTKPFEPSYFIECARKSGLDWTRIAECRLDEDRVWGLQLQASKDTPADHKWVPWPVVNGEHVDEQSSLLTLVCEAYTAAGGSVPACDHVLHRENVRTEVYELMHL